MAKSAQGTCFGSKKLDSKSYTWGMKQCSMCKKIKNLQDFRKRSKSADGLMVWCRECCAEYERLRYQNGDRARKEDNTKRAQTRNREFVWEYLKDHPCVDCGEKDPIVLEFDHRDPRSKSMNLSIMLRRSSVQKIKEEIEKCDVRCANCHRRRTGAQFGFWKSVR